MLLGLKETQRVPVPEVTPEIAFDYALDFTNSILNVDIEIALLKGSEFLYNWVLFNYPETTDLQKAAMRNKPFEYLSELQTVAA
jgi:hypothetical protein